MKKLAEERGGQCLSDQLGPDDQSLLSFQCHEGHVWNAHPAQIQAGVWCYTCSYVDWRKRSLEEMQTVAALRGGRCLSTAYINNKTHLLWECAKGHRWNAMPVEVATLHGQTWCKECAWNSRRISLADVQEIAQTRGGKCLSKTCKNSRSHLLWRCKEGHVWEAVALQIIQGTWCPECSIAMRRMSIEEMHEIAGAKGGACLSTEYNGATVPLRWKCAQGHEWMAVPTSIKHRTWCPQCAKRQYARTIEDMHTLAAEKGGRCISMEYKNNKTSLKWQCADGHIWDARANNILTGQWCPVCAGNHPLSLDEMKRIAQNLGGECLSQTYRRSSDKLQWRCAEGHIWRSVVSSVKKGHWCQKCAIRKRTESDPRKLSIEEMRQLAAERGGQCLSIIYTNSSSKLLWSCSEGHTWLATPGHVKTGEWCRVCAYRAKAGASQRLTMEEIQKLAQTHGGICLSTVYRNINSLLEWKCIQGHRWTAKLEAVRYREKWCPQCEEQAHPKRKAA